MTDSAGAGGRGWATGWSLPFSERYHHLRRSIPHYRQLIAYHQAEADKAHHELDVLELQWAALLERDGAQLAAYQAHVAAVRENLKQAGWFGGPDAAE
jgi:multidrug resistance efflux pump